MDLLEQLNAWLKTIPYTHKLGVVVDALNDDGVSCHMPFQDMFIGNFQLPALHGGSTASFLETAAIVAANRHAIETGSGQVALPVSMTTSYLRSATANDLRATARVVKQGRRLVQVYCEAFQVAPNKPVATLQASLMLSEKNT
jgi:uncharacterized protein (TIGR00369 family)